jgi:hypothetical protein
MKGIFHMEDPSRDGRIILKWILKEEGRGMWAGFI